jgi:hypothetical protein
MVGQETYGFWIDANVLLTWETTVQVENRDTMAEVALTLFYESYDNDMGAYGYIGITKCWSASGTETFLASGSISDKDYRQALYREGMTKLRIEMVSDVGFTRGRLMLNYWS